MNKNTLLAGLIIILSMSCAVKGMTQENPIRRLGTQPVIMDYTPERMPTPPAAIKGKIAGVQLVEEYRPDARSYFELLPADLTEMISRFHGQNIQDATSFIRNVYGSSRELKQKLSDPVTTQSLLVALAIKFYSILNNESLVRAAIELDTDGARDFLAKQKDFLFESIKKSRDPRYAGFARAIIASGAPINIEDSRGDTPLMLAIDPDKRRNPNPPLNADIANLLLDKGAETKKRRPGGREVPQLIGNAIAVLQPQSGTVIGMAKLEAFTALENRVKASPL